MRDVAEVLQALKRSSFRASFHLGPAEARYLQAKGMDAVLEHARRFVEERLAPANPARDGRQTPKQGHPAFIAQHATATCCRSCLRKWHQIPKHQPLSPQEIDYIVTVIGAWLQAQAPPAAADSTDGPPPALPLWNHPDAPPPPAASPRSVRPDQP